MITDLSVPITSLARSPTTQAHSLAPVGGLSRVIGATEPPLLEVTIPQLLEDTVRRHGNREAAVFLDAGIRWRWSELARLADRVATGLLALGLKRGDRIGIWSPNRPEWLVLQYASARIGLVLVTINPAYRVTELEYALNKVQCAALLIAERFKTSDYVAMVQSLAPELAHSAPGKLRAAKLPHLRALIKTGDTAVPGMMTYDELLDLGGPAWHLQLPRLSSALTADDAVNIQFTSGTTGAPKGATLSHRNIVNNAHFVSARMQLSATDKLCIPVPLYHCFGMVMGSLACATTGAAMVFPAESFDAASCLEAIERERCSALYGVPTMFVSMLEHDDFAARDFSSLRSGIMAGAPCPVEVMKSVMNDMHMREVTIAYGMTETSPVSFQSHTDDPIERRVTTVGRVHPHVECKIIDEHGATVAPGMRGELCTRGYSVMRGYWNDETLTAEVIDEEGWMHTGDLAALDEDGYCSIVGRVKDMVIRGGENIYPREVEEYLHRHPAVVQAQVFGIPDEKFGEELVAWIVLKEGMEVEPQELREFCRGQIAHYKIPRHIRIKTELPMTVTGKPQKFLMRDATINELREATTEDGEDGS